MKRTSSLSKFVVPVAGLGLAALVSGARAATTLEEVVHPNDPMILPKPAINEPADHAEKNFAGFVSFVTPTDYISRGLVLNDDGFIIQPTGELDYTFFRSDGPIDKATGFVGVWSDFTSDHTGATTGDYESWFEFDWYVGGSVRAFDDWTFTLTYIEFISPSNAFGTSKNLELKVAYDDAELLGKFALSPYVKLFRETHGKAGSGSDFGTYVELGVAPSVPLTDPDAALPIKLTFPVDVGLGFDQFYGDADGDNETLGFVSAGAVFSVPVTFLNDRGVGTWTFTTGASVYYFGDGVHDFNVGQGIDERFRVVGQAGLTCAF